MYMADNLQMLTPKEVAEILGVHRKTVHLWLRTGKLQGIKISYRAWRIPRTALISFIEQSGNVSQPNKPIVKKGEDIDIPNKMLLGETTTAKKEYNDTPQSKMRHYIRDIMGEQPHEER